MIFRTARLMKKVGPGRTLSIKYINAVQRSAWQKRSPKKQVCYRLVVSIMFIFTLLHCRKASKYTLYCVKTLCHSFRSFVTCTLPTIHYPFTYSQYMVYHCSTYPFCNWHAHDIFGCGHAVKMERKLLQWRSHRDLVDLPH